MKKRKIRIVIVSVVLILAILVGGAALYVSDYYRADVEAIDAFSKSINVVETEIKGAITYGSGQENTAFIFYPGGKVEYTAYIPLMKLVAEKGVFCILVKMPANLAVLDVNAAQDIREQYSDIDHWYIGGHSLGGSMAASYLESHAEKYQGLILLGAYSTANLSETNLDVLSIFGSEDQVMNREKYEKYRPNLPKDFAETVFQGGCHAYFGMYGAQDGDGTPSLTVEEQIELTAETICGFILEN